MDVFDFSELFHLALDSYSGRLVWNSYWNRGQEDITVYPLKLLLVGVTVNLKGFFVEQTLHHDILDSFMIVISLHPNYEDEEKNCISCCCRHCQRNIPGLFWFLSSLTLIYCITVSFKCATLNIFTLCHAWQWCTIRWHREEVLKTCWTFLCTLNR